MKKTKVDAVLEKKDKNTKEEIHIVNNNSSTKTIILGLVGLVLVLMPDTINQIIGIIIGVILLIFGVNNIIRYSKTKELGNLDLFSGILYTALAIIIILNPHSVINLIAICLGIYLFINGLMKLRFSFVLKESNVNWIPSLVVAVLFALCGFMLIFNPFSGIAITKLAGIYLLVMSILEIFDIYVFQKK